ncbi:MAG TPA: cytochrome c [Cyclobacteriaceae bacterium]|nr:cytochrome c [Cyclobacteriaceae bacterium]
MKSFFRFELKGVGGWVLKANFNWLLAPLRSKIGNPLFIVLCLLFIGCNSDPKFQQYFVQGEQLYQTHCSNCHQKNGTGLGLVYPPIAASDFMDANPEKVMCLMKRGISGEISVNGKIFNQPMPGIPSLTELEIAEISTFIYNSWGREKGLIEVNSVSKALKVCPAE